MCSLSIDKKMHVGSDRALYRKKSSAVAGNLCGHLGNWVIISVIQFLPSGRLPEQHRSFVSSRIYHCDGALSVACLVCFCFFFNQLESFMR